MKQSVNDYSGEKKADEVKLSEAVSLIGELAKKISDKTAPYFPKTDIPRGEKLVLQCLVNTDGVTQLDIVRSTGFKPPTISIMLQKMEGEGLVTRRPDEFDLRAMRVYISELGLEHYNKAVKVIKTVEDKLLKGLSHEETEMMVSTMKKIKSNLDEF